MPVKMISLTVTEKMSKLTAMEKIFEKVNLGGKSSTYRVLRLGNLNRFNTKMPPARTCTLTHTQHCIARSFRCLRYGGCKAISMRNQNYCFRSFNSDLRETKSDRRLLSFFYSASCRNTKDVTNGISSPSVRLHALFRTACT